MRRMTTHAHRAHDRHEPEGGQLTSDRVAGHTLRHEGAPHVVSETGETVRVWNGYGGVGGYGRGLCSCGMLSDLLDSAHQRKKWHRAHKAEVEAGGGGYKASDVERFWSRVAKGEGGCWNWTGYIAPNGYGRATFQGGMKMAHRVAFMITRGAIPRGLELDHLCRNRACVNPDHLEPVTHRENVLRGESPVAYEARATHCKYGHEFTPENTGRRTKRNERYCKTCNALRNHIDNAKRAGRTCCVDGTCDFAAAYRERSAA